MWNKYVHLYLFVTKSPLKYVALLSINFENNKKFSKIAITKAFNLDQFKTMTGCHRTRDALSQFGIKRFNEYH